jgi:hypothetical protein
MSQTLVAVGGITATLLLIIFLVAWRLRRSNAAQPPADDSPATPQVQLLVLKESPRFSGVSVQPHCRASSGLAGKKYPLQQAPELPVPGCDAKSCACRYIGLPERRHRAERRVQVDRRGALRMEMNRRLDRARRRIDKTSWTDQYNI